MSTDAVLDYATNRLGMVKGNRSQINYITVNGSDSVVYNDDSGSKAGEEYGHRTAYNDVPELR